jgi:plastocyanin
LTLSVGIGMRRPDFPGSLKGQRIVSAITVVLVAGTLASAILTSGSPSEHAKITKDTPVVLGGAPIPTQPAVNTGATSTTTTAASTTTENPKEPPATVSEGGHKLTIAASASGLLAYNTKTLEASAGKVSIAFTNMAPLEHNLTIAQGAKVLGATPTFVGGVRTLTVTLKPGKYVFYCSVPGHRQAGMEGTLTVVSGSVANTASSASSSTTPASPAAPAEPTKPAEATKPAEPAKSASGTQQLALSANPAGLLAYNTKSLSAKAGKVTITFTNNSPLEHNVTVAEGSKVLGTTPTFKGGSKTLTLTLKAGKYVYYCSVPGHRQAGMEGTLTVS